MVVAPAYLLKSRPLGSTSTGMPRSRARAITAWQSCGSQSALVVVGENDGIGSAHQFQASAPATPAARPRDAGRRSPHRAAAIADCGRRSGSSKWWSGRKQSCPRNRHRPGQAMRSIRAFPRRLPQNPACAALTPRPTRFMATLAAPRARSWCVPSEVPEPALRARCGRHPPRWSDPA